MSMQYQIKSDNKKAYSSAGFGLLHSKRNRFQENKKLLESSFVKHKEVTYTTNKTIRPIDPPNQAVRASYLSHSLNNIRINSPLSASVLIPGSNKGEGTAGSREKPKGKGGKKPDDSVKGKLKESCNKPLSMNKVTKGSFIGGKKLEDYFPGGDTRLRGVKIWDHSDSAGPWDLGNRVGANIQLYGTIPTECRSESFSLDQRLKFTRSRVNGNPDADEGKTIDDIKESRQDASKPPFRQEWKDPWGDYIISMADPPSIDYVKASFFSPGSNIELDREYTTSLVGPGSPGEAKSVNWSQSIRIEKGVVTRNKLD